MSTRAADAPVDLPGLVNRFVGFEEAEGLWERELGGCGYWHYARWRVFHDVAEKMGVLGALPVQGRPDYVRHRPALGETRELLKRYDPRRLSRSEILIADHPRHAEWQGRMVSSFTQPLLAELERTHWTLRFSDRGKHHLGDGRSNTLYVDALYRSSQRAYAVAHRWTKTRKRVREEAGFLRRRVELAFGLAPPLSRCDALIWNAVRCDQGWGELCEWILDRIQPRLLVSVVHYNPAWLTLTLRARRRGVRVAELQHGTVSRQHLPYRFAEGRHPPGAPDDFLSFGSFWSQMARGLNLPRERVHAIGFAWLERQVSAHASASPRPKTLLVLSQGTVSEALSKLTCEAAPRLRAAGWSIKYRLHPNEVQGYERRLPWLAGAPIVVSTGRDESVYAALAGASAQLGVYTTALFEGLAFGVPALVARLPGSEALRPLVELGAARFVDGARSLAAAIDDLDRQPGRDDHGSRVWSTSAAENFLRFVDDALGPRGRRDA